MKCRKNVKDLTLTEKTAYVNACLALKNSAPSQLSNAQYNTLLNAIQQMHGLAVRNNMVKPTNRYDDYVLLHVAAGLGAHRRPGFLPWHRRYLEYFEADLQAVSGNPNLTIPYWDWSDGASSPFTADFLGGDGNPADDYKVSTGPFAHAGGQWDLNIIAGFSQASGAKDDVNYLRRHFGRESISLNPQWSLPPASYLRDTVGTATYDAVPWDHGSGTQGFRNQLEGWFNPPGPLAPPLLHNMGHVWTGGTMLPPTSPNDPVFWLNHAMVDMMWAVWQQKHGNPYLPGPAETHTNLQISGVYRHRLNDDMWMITETFGTAATPASVLNYHNAAAPSSGYRYATDLPEITNETGTTLSFGNVPQGLTQYKGVRFRVKSCRNVKFRITTVPSGDFTTPFGINFTLNPVENQPFTDILVWFGYVSPGAGPPVNSNAQIRTYIDDDEGFYAASPGDEHLVGTYNISLTATPVARPTAATMLVLDFSGSMNQNAGGSSTKRDLLINAASVFAGLVRNTDGVGMVRYSSTATKIMDVTAGAPGLGTNIFNTLSAISAGGMTSIGAGIQEGVTVLNAGQAAAMPPYDQLASIILTDGKENTPPMIADVAASINSTTYAVGFGQPNQVDTVKLNAITQNSGGDLVITGDISTQEQEYLLTKYFVQILAGITKQNTVLDPRGELFWGSKHRIPFDLAETDVDSDVILLCPFPKLVNFLLETPDGDIIDPGRAAIEPNVAFHSEKKAAFYRMSLPAVPKDPKGSHAGRWHAVLSLSEENIKELMRDPDFESFWFKQEDQSLSYSLIVNSTSNLNLEASLQQKDFDPGTPIHLYAELTEYGIPLIGRAHVWADVQLPGGAAKTVHFEQSSPGSFEAVFPTGLYGVYTFRVRAEGDTGKGNSFTRETTLTGTVFSEQDGQDRTPEERRPAKEDAFCHLVKCLLSQEGIQNRLREWDVDPKAVLKCFERYCRALQSTGRTAADMIGELTEKSSAEQVPSATGTLLRSLMESAVGKQLMGDAALGIAECQPGVEQPEPEVLSAEDLADEPEESASLYLETTKKESSRKKTSKKK
ncbi:MAG: tyrosinase family protein [Acidobacteriota bacterium]|nr:tyrosinase family protein [Acidobacteriota bacterium]